MTRYHLYRDESRAPGGREYLHHVVTSTGLRLSEVVELPTSTGAVKFEPAEAAMWVLKGYEKEEIK